MLACSIAALTTTQASAQQQLPGIVIQGATLDGSAGKSSRASGQANVSANEAVQEADVPVEDDGISGVAAYKIGSSVSVVTRADLERQQIRHAADALRSLPGVSVSRQGGPNNVTVVRLRGAESNQTLVLIDGVEVNSGTDGFFDFSNLATEDIEQIEVLRGPQSGLYGTGAIGGVINIITKSGKGPFTIRAKAEGGSFNTGDASLQVSGGNDRAHGILTLHGRRTDGINIALQGGEEDYGRLSNFAFSGGVRLLDNLKLDGTVRQSRNRAGRDNLGLVDGFFVPIDQTSFFETGVWIGRLQATLETFDGRLVSKFYTSRARTESEDTDTDPLFGAFTESISEGHKHGITSTLRLDSPQLPHVRHFVTGQVEQERESFVQPTGDGFKRERERTSAVGEVRGEYFDSLFLTGTVRRDDNEAFQDFTTWRAAAALKVPNTPFRLHASAGTGVKYPSFGEQFGFFFGFTPNPDLSPEKSFGYDAGVETTLLGGRLVFDVTYFDQNLENEIDFRTLPGFTFQPFNRGGESKRSGLEVSARYALTKHLTLSGAYTYLDATEDDGSEEVRRPPHGGRADLNYAFADGRGNFNLAAIYNGEMKDIVFNVDPTITRVALQDYWLVTAAASYKVAPGIELFGRVENLLDEDYQEVFGFNSPGTAAFAGVRFTYEDASPQTAGK